MERFGKRSTKHHGEEAVEKQLGKEKDKEKVSEESTGKKVQKGPREEARGIRVNGKFIFRRVGKDVWEEGSCK